MVDKAFFSLGSVIAAVKQHGDNLSHASLFKADKEVKLAALKKNVEALKFVELLKPFFHFCV